VIALWATRVLRGAPIAVPAAAPLAAGGGNSRVDEVVASARLFGSRRPGVLSDNVRPLGVVADAAGRGSVIVSVDGQPPKVYRVGDTLDGRLVSAIRPEEIELDSGGARQTFRLPLPRPSTPGVTVLGTGPQPVIVPALPPPSQLPSMARRVTPDVQGPARDDGRPTPPAVRGQAMNERARLQQMADQPAPPLER
jgi:hypothetical protein